MHRISSTVVVLLMIGAVCSPTFTAAEETPALGPKADTEIHLNFREPTSVSEIFQEVGKAADIEIFFDPQLIQLELSINLEGTTASSAFDRIAKAAAKLWAPMDAQTILVADYTQEKQRQFEPLLIRPFVLEHADVRDVDRLLRSLAEARRVSSHPELDTVVVRASAAKMAVIERLISIIDQPRGEVEVAVEFLHLRKGVDISDRGLRFTEEEIDAIRDLDPKLFSAHSTVNLVGSGSASFHIEAGKAKWPNTRLDLVLRVHQHQNAGEITLDINAEISHLSQEWVGPNGERSVVAWGNMENSLRLSAGEVALLRFPDRNSESQVAIALTPTIIRPAGLDAESLEAFWVGTENRWQTDEAPQNDG